MYLKLFITTILINSFCFAQSNKATITNSIDLILTSPHLNSQTIARRHRDLNSLAKKHGLDQDAKIKHKLQTLANYSSIKEVFEDCARGNRDEEKYYDRILNQVREAAFTECVSAALINNTVPKHFVNSIQKITAHVQMKDMNEKLIDESLQSAVTSFVGHRKKLKDKDFSYKSIEKAICAKIDCNHDRKEKIKKMYKIASTDTQDIKPKETMSVVMSINSQLMLINKKAKKVSAPVKEGYFFDSAKKENQRTKEQYAEYKSEFTKILVSNEFNGLMFTDHFKDTVGTIQTLDDLEKDHPGRYALKEHETIGSKDVAIAYKQAENKIIDQIELLLDEDISDNTTPEDFIESSAKFVKHYPASVGRMLIKDPYKANSICNLVSYVDQKAKSDAKWDKAFKIGGMALGVGLMATGIGAGIGSVVLVGSAASTAATVATATIVGSIALGSTEAAYHAKEAISAYNDNKIIEQSILSGTGDGKSHQEAQNALAKMEDAQIDAAISLGFSAVDMGAVKTAMMTSKYGKSLMSRSMSSSQKSKYLDDISENYQELSSNKDLMEYFGRNMDKLGADKKEKMTEFMAILARVDDEQLRKSLIDDMANWNPERFKETVERSVKLERSCL